MAKLRVIQERKTESTNVPDLRGFGDPELFQKSGVESHLRVGGVSESRDLESICGAYELTMEKEGDGIMMRVAHPKVGAHKIEAMKLFVASLEIAEAFPGSRCHIFQTNGMRGLMHERTRQTQNEFAAETKKLLDEGMQSTSKISLHAPVAEWIHRAGLAPKPATTTWTHLSDGEISAAQRQLGGTAQSMESENVVSLSSKRRVG